MLELAGVDYAYPSGAAALCSVSVAIQAGESLALLGANGSGKSSLLRILDGLVYPQAGVFRAFGEPVTEAAMRDDSLSFRFRRKVGFVFQNADAQLFSSTVRDDLAFGPIQMGMPQSDVDCRVADVAAMLGISGVLDRAPFELSGGEKRKAALGSVLVVNPEVLLLDEPTSGLDPRSQAALVDLLLSLHAAGKTMVIATHDLDVARAVALRAVVLTEEHTVAADAEVDEVLHNRDLLLSVNLIHEHAHYHGSFLHTHPHAHDAEHHHEHL